MKYPHNIEAVKFGAYRAGYDSAGYAWRIYGESGSYRATSQHGLVTASITGATLEEISAKLEKANARELIL